MIVLAGRKGNERAWLLQVHRMLQRIEMNRVMRWKIQD